MPVLRVERSRRIGPFDNRADESAMTRRKRYVICACIVVICIYAAAHVGALLPLPGVTKANFDRIKVGMTVAEIEMVFGESATFDGDETGSHLADWHQMPGVAGGAVARVVLVNGVATQTIWFESTETFAEKARRWLHLPK